MINEIFDSAFHKRYVGGEGEIAEELSQEFNQPVVGMTMEQTLDKYRIYVRDQKAELPEEVMEETLSNQRTENDRK
jgi:hypothetical protein